MSCFVTLLFLRNESHSETALFINKDFIVSVRPDENAAEWLDALAMEFAAMHDADIVRQTVDVASDIDWQALDTTPQITALLQGDTPAFLKAQGFNELDYIDALETILMRSYMDLYSAA